MADKQIIEAMAGIDTEGHKGFWCSECGDIDGANTRNDETCDLCGLPAQSGFPDYLTSHDACQRVIDGLSNDMRYAYMDFLCLGLATPEEWSAFGTQAGEQALYSKCFQATPRQKCTAILKAKGLWQTA